MTRTRVFLSYASANAPLAMRVYNDLRRSGVRIWRYESDGEIGVDYEEESAALIREASAFCLLDTPAARVSPNVKSEVALAVAQESAGLRILIALGEPEGAWRNPELFPRQNVRRYAGLHPYDEGIRVLCREFGVHYVPPFTLPRDTDFQEELQRMPALSVMVRQYLFDMYSGFRRRHDAADLRVAKAFLIVLLSACEDHGMRLLTPAIALAVMYANAGRDADAHRTFSDAAAAFPDDPRPHAGMGAASYHMGRYADAAEAFAVSLRLIERSSERLHREQHGYVVNFLAKSLLSGQRPADALAAIEACPADHRGAALSLTHGQVLLALHDPAAATPRLAVAAASGDSDVRLEARLLLGDAHAALGDERAQVSVLEGLVRDHPSAAEPRRRLAALFARREEWPAAIDQFREAIALEDRLKDRAELGMILRARGRVSEALAVVEPCLSRNVANGVDEYYLGLAFHVAGRYELALAAYERSRADLRLSNWPYYDDLVQSG